MRISLFNFYLLKTHSSKVNRTVSIAMAIYAAAEGYHDSVLDGLCEAGTGYSNTWASNVSLQIVKLVFPK